jgi:hypothetical protein
MNLRLLHHGTHHPPQANPRLPWHPPLSAGVLARQQRGRCPAPGGLLAGVPA